MLADPGRMLGKYQLIAEIARGGMGVVYLAMVQGPGGFNKLVVVKELKPELVEEPAFLTMFLDEARLAARLSHPNIVQTNEVGNDGDRYFMAMDYLDGRGLDQIRRRSKIAGFGLSVPMQLRVVCDMLAGLDYAHKLTDFDGSPLNIVHRDVSPQNVFVTFDGQVKLLDFGIAKASDSMHETHAGVVKGKVSYMSPEQGRGWKVDARADVFSAGVMLWEALTGKRMRDGKNDQEKLWALVSEDPPRASSIKPWVPPELDDICARAMAWDRENRYPSAGAMQRDLESYLSTTGTRVSAREVGACVTELFREDRANTNGVIEAHIARARGGTLRDGLPVIEIAPRLSMGSPTPSDQRPAVRHPHDPDLATSLDSPNARSADASAAAAHSDPRRISGLRHLRPVLIAGAAGVAIAIAVIVFIARATSESGPITSRADPMPHVVASTPPPSPAPPATAVAPVPASVPTAPPPVAKPAEPPTAPKQTMIDVEVRVSPGTAAISIDGKDVEGNPFSTQFPADEVMHRVRASAPGYVTKSSSVAFNANVTLDFSLERINPPSPPPTARQPPVRTPPRVVQQARTTPPRQPDPPRAVEIKAPEPARVDPTPPRADPPPAASTPPELVNPQGGNKPTRTIERKDPYSPGGGP
ncbi:MAG TPA: protein kinase [Kofleriaceae bacterium]|nr:protein kinase [Kofleriaceae bacterium]